MRTYLRSGLVRAGLLLLAIGTGPLVGYVLLAKYGHGALGVTPDPNPNPVMFGILAMLTFWPSVIMIGIGVLMVRRALNLAAMGRNDPRVPLPDGVDPASGLRRARGDRDRV